MGKADVFTGMSLTEKLIWLKKFGNGGGSTPTYEDRTATGNPVIFTTNFAQNAKALSVDFTPKQNLNGYSKPWAGGAGENLIPFIACDAGTRNGITWTKNADGSIHVKGTATISETMSRTQNVLITDKSYLTYFEPGTYAITSFGGRLWVQFTDEEQSKQTFSAKTFPDGYTAYYTFTEKTAIYVRVSVKSADGAVDKDIKVSVVKGETAPTEWTPYENICPITGADSVDIVANSVTHEFDLGRTVYGGTLNAKTGVLTIDKVKIPVSDASMMPEGSNGWKTGTNANRIGFAIDPAILPRQNDSLDVLCNIGYASNNANVNNAFEVGACSLYKGNACMYFRYCVPTSIATVEDAYAYLKNNNCEFTVPLDTPLTYQLTAQQIVLLEGENVIATDGDSLNVTYQVKV